MMRGDMSNPSSFTPNAALPEKKGCGCFGTGCAVLLIFLVVVTGLGCWAGYMMVNYIKSFTSDKPAQIAIFEGSEDEWLALKKRVDAFKATAAAGNAASLQLTDREINMLISRHPDFKALKGHAYVQIVNGVLGAQVSFPLDGVPTFSGRYLNADVKFRTTFLDGILTISAEEMRVTDQTAPPEMLKMFDQMGAEMMKDPEFSKLMEKMKSIQMKDNSLLIEVKAGPAALPTQPEAGP